MIETWAKTIYQEESERSIGCHTDEWEVADGDEGGQHGAKDDPSVDGLLPVVGALETHYELERKKKLSETLNKFFLVESACSWRVIH